VDKEADKVGTTIREACRTMPDPPPLAIFDHVYTQPNPILEAERDQFAAYLESFEGDGAAR
jgi:pyruvate dehydrogenase E1 component alpha subunit